MAATYSKVPLGVPSLERVNLITAVVTGDKIDMDDVLGRPARGLRIITANTTDTITYRLNSLQKLQRANSASVATEVESWSAAGGFPVFTATGATTYETPQGLQVSSIEIVSVTGPASIEIVVW